MHYTLIVYVALFIETAKNGGGGEVAQFKDIDPNLGSSCPYNIIRHTQIMSKVIMQVVI